MTSKVTIFLVAAFAFLTAHPANAQKVTEVDVCIYGGTSAGIIAAYTAKRLGKSVIVVEPGRHVGGLTTGGLGYTDIGNKFAVTGLARDFYRRIGTHYGKFEQWIFEPHVAEQTFQQYIKAASLNIVFDHRLVSVEKKDGTVKQIVIESSSNPSATTNQFVRAKMFIDCTYEGDLMAKAGVSYTTGREANSQYNETYNGVQVRDKHQFLDGIDPYKIPGKPESGLLWGISSEKLPPNGTGDKKIQAYNFRICLSGDKKIQAYNFRICLSRDRNNMIPITQPEDYDSTRYELLIRVL
ncbi:MAG TPA: FAD-dependent oxidoreductase, partial [Chryseolinea sp.]|nr:FAD-dependent oxidoreductase [Chryseolinea sp.]